MDLRVPEILSDVRKQHLYFLALPSQHLREESEREGFEALFDLGEVPRTNRFLSCATSRQSIIRLLS